MENMLKVNVISFILCLILTKIFCQDEFDIQSKYDACGCSSVKDGVSDTIEDFNASDGHISLFCCAKNFLTGIDFNVTWSFLGTIDPYHKPVQLPDDQNCYGQKISIVKAPLLDNGKYTCRVQGKNGSLHQKSITFYAHDSGSFRGKPSIDNSSEIVYTEIGKRVNLNCSFFLVNSTSNPDVVWRKYFINESNYYSEVIALSLPDVTQSSLVERKGLYFSELMIKRVIPEHIGNYSCQMVTWSDVAYKNFSVYNQENPHKTLERKYEVLSICVVILLSCVFISLCVIYRMRMHISLKWRKLTYNKADLCFKDYNHDVFIVSGPSVAYWVQTVLLNKLESVWLYDCFYPDRDMLAGQESAKVICEKLKRSQRTIIVITECLLRSGWCDFMVNQAVHNTLASSSKVLAINLSDITTSSNDSPEVQNIMRVLMYIKKIKCPLDLLPHSNTMNECVDSGILDLNFPKVLVDIELANVQEQEELSNNSKDKEEEVPKTFLPSTLSIPNLPYSKSLNHLTSPVVHQSSSLSDLKEKKYKEIDWKIPKDQCQRVVNMISGSSEFINSESCWKFTEDDKEEAQRTPSQPGYTHNYIFDYEVPFPKCVRKKLYSESSECPLSPYAITPFFGEEAMEWLSRRKTFKENFVSFLFGDPKDLFWKNLHLHLPTHPLHLRPGK